MMMSQHVKTAKWFAYKMLHFQTAKLTKHAKKCHIIKMPRSQHAKSTKCSTFKMLHLQNAKLTKHQAQKIPL